MSRPKFNQPSDLWCIDGSLRDVYVFNTAIGDWDKMLTLARAHPYEYLRDGSAHELPTAKALFQNREHSHWLSVKAGKVSLNCHFFTQEEIELNIDPREVAGSEEHISALQFIEQLAEVTQKDVVVTAENCREATLLRYEQLGRRWHVYELPEKNDA